MHTYWQRFHLIQQSAEQAEQLCRTRHGADEVIEDTPTSPSTAVNTHNWKSVQVVNSHLVCDPTIRQPGFDLPRQRWSLLNCLRTEQGHCGACRRKWQDPFHCIRCSNCMHVKASVSARMSLVRLVQYSLVLFNCMFPFC